MLNVLISVDILRLSLVAKGLQIVDCFSINGFVELVVTVRKERNAAILVRDSIDGLVQIRCSGRESEGEMKPEAGCISIRKVHNDASGHHLEPLKTKVP